MDTLTDRQLVKACLANDRQAQRQLYDRFRTPLYRLCLRYARDRPEADDFLQDGFIKIFADLPRYRGDGALGGWMRRVVLNICLQHLRRKRPETALDEAPEAYTEAEDVFAEAPPDPRLLIAYLQQLPDGYRTVFNLYVIEEYSHKEIARQLDISIGASKSQLHKAKAMLRRLAAPVFNTSHQS